MTSCNSLEYLGQILAKIFARSWQDLAKILLRYPWRVDPGSLQLGGFFSRTTDAVKETHETLLS